MTTHIVKMKDTLENIAKLYSITEDEIKEENKFISNWDHLIPGTKLKLPELSRYLQEELDNREPFLEEYYPVLDMEEIKKEVFPKILKEEEKIEEHPKAEPIKKIAPAYQNYIGNPYTSYYVPYYDNYYSNYRGYPFVYKTTTKK